MNAQPQSSTPKFLPLVYAALTLMLVAAFLLQGRFPEGATRTALADLFQCSALAMGLTTGAQPACAWLSELWSRKSDYAALLIFLLAAYVAGFFFFRFFFNAEQDIKVYDFSAYWIRLIEDQQLIARSIPDYMKQLLATFNREYTHLAVFPLIPVSRVLGLEFGAYCFSVYALYYLPACFFLTILTLRLAALARDIKPGIAAFIVCFVFFALSVGFIWPVMRGYLDVAGVLIAAVMLNLTLRWNGIDFDWKRNAALAALSFLLLFTRRWYAYYIVGFYFSFGVAALADMVARKNFSVKKLGCVFLNMGMIAALASLCIFLINPEIFALFLLKDYAAAYSVYKGMSVMQNLWVAACNAGLLWLAAFFAGVFILAKSGDTRLICLRLLLAAAVAVTLFCAVQDMGYHHHYLPLPTLLILGGVFCVFAVQRFRLHDFPVLAFPLLALSAVNFAFAFAPSLQGAAALAQPLTSEMRVYPMRNPDYAVVKHLVGELRQKLGGGGKKAYVVGDSPELSPELLKRSFLPELVDAAPFVMVNNIVDMRDGFPSQLFLADYILTHDPFTTVFPSRQQVSYQAYDMLLHDPKLASHYALEAEYKSPEGRILLYRKSKQADAALVDVLKQRLQGFYPNDPFVYEPNYFIALSQIGDNAKYSFNFWEQSFELQKEAGVALKMSINDASRFSNLSFAVSCWTPGLELIVRNQDGVVFRSPLLVQEKALYSAAVAGSDYLSVSIVEAELGAQTPAFLTLYPKELR